MRIRLTCILFFIGLGRAMAQAAPNWLEESLYGNGKINTVVAVVSIIILGIGVWLWMQDRRLSRMEKTIEKQSM